MFPTPQDEIATDADLLAQPEIEIQMGGRDDPSLDFACCHIYDNYSDERFCVDSFSFDGFIYRDDK